jgi:hypothetical protein
MKSNSGTRLYKVEIASGDDAGTALEIRVLAVKEKEFVVSNFDTKDSENAIVAKINELAGTGTSCPIEIGLTLTEQDLIDYFTVVGGGIYTVTDVYNEDVILEAA